MLRGSPNHQVFMKLLLAATVVLTISIAPPCYAQTPSPIQLRNAYEVALQLNKYKSGTLSPTDKEKLLGAIIWYCNLDESQYNDAELFRQLSGYSSLKSIVLSLFGDIFTFRTFFSIPNLSDMDYELIPNKELRAQLKRFRQSYDRYIKLYKSD